MEEDDLSGDVDFDFFEVNSTSHRSVSPDVSTQQKTADKEESSRQKGRNVAEDQGSVRSGSSIKITAKIPTGSPRAGSDRESYSSDEFDSEGEGSGSDTGAGKRRRTPTPSHGKQASNSVAMGSAASKHTAPGREASPDSPVESPRSRSSSRSSSKGRDSSRSRSRSSSRSSSDSVTDVSPLSSPNLSPELRRKAQAEKGQVRHQKTTASRDKRHRKHHPGVPGRKQVRTIGVGRQGQERPMHKDVRFSVKEEDEDDDDNVGEGTSGQDPLLLTEDTDTIELNRLLAAVLDMEKRPRSSTDSPTAGQQRRNMSFSNDEVRRIEQENHRLLNEIIKKKRPMSASSTSSRMSRASTSSVSSTRSRGGTRRDPNSSARIYHTALNRMKDQQRIERENLAMLKRLETARATPGMSRQELLSNFDQQRRYFGNITKSKTPTHTPIRARRPLSAGVSRPRTGAFATSSSAVGIGSPLHTSKPRPKSGRVRPVWDSGW